MIDSIQSLLRKKYWTIIKKSDNVLLKDSDMTVEISHLPNDVLKICVPGGKTHLEIINDRIHYKQSCDFLILISQNNHIDVYFIEMKKTPILDENHIPQKACDQILCTVPVFDYLISMGQTHFPTEKKKNIYKYFAIIGEKKYEKLDKQQVKSKKSKKCSYKNEKFRIIYSSSSIPLEHLR